MAPFGRGSRLALRVKLWHPGEKVIGHEARGSWINDIGSAGEVP